MEYNITTIATKHPSILKFQANHFLVKGTYEFASIDDTKNAPLAYELLQLPFVKTVYIASNFVAIQRYEIVEWDDVKDAVAQRLVDYLNEGEPVVHEATTGGPQAITVYAEATPNPGVMKFVANKPIVPALYEFKNIDEAKDAPLATALFQKPYVKQVFMDENYVSVTKYDIGNWDEITVELRELIRDFMASDQEAVITQKVASTKPTEGTPTKEKPAPAPSANFEEGTIEAKIVSILEEYVKPAVAADGGNIAFEKFDANTKAVHVVLQGACSGCPSSTFTLKNGIETMLQNMLGDQVGQVIAVNG